MTRSFLSAFLLRLAAFSVPLIAQTPANLSGRWVITAEFYGAPRYMRLQLTQDGNKLTGNLNGDKLEGTVSGTAIHALVKDERGSTDDITATLNGMAISGTMVSTDIDDPTHPMTVPFTAGFVPPIVKKAAQRHDFTPTVFYRSFSASNKPVLTIDPGDTVHTTTVDAGGTDEKSKKRVAGGNPQTGPFFIQGAVPGDVLAIHIVHLKLNRDYAVSDDGIVMSGLNNSLAVKMKDNGKTIRWHLDSAKGTASPEKPGDHLKSYTIPLKPMLGCIATAPGPAMAAPPTGDSGFFGGNMDFNEITDGATVYLPVNNPGGLLYVGDAHAAQGDGELNGNALETSMDVEFTVDVIPNKRLGSPRVETADAIMSMGLMGSLDDAFKEATAAMSSWLEQDYKLTPSEIAQVIGSAAEYKVSEVADRNSGIVLKLSKQRLATLSASSK